MMQASSKPYQSFIMSISLWVLLVACLFVSPHVYAGEMYRWVDAQGRIHLTDTPPPSRREMQDLKVYGQSDTPPLSERSNTPPADVGGAKQTSTTPDGVIVVEAVLNRRLTVPLRLDQEAELTVLTKQVAEELRIPSMDHMPKRQFGTTSGMVELPITSLRSLRVGTAEARDVIVAIDVEGHMPVGLLGRSFLRHFKVSLDQQQGQVTFER